MIIVGAKGLAKEVLEIFALRGELDNLFFFDNISSDIPSKLFDRFTVLRDFEGVKDTFARLNDTSFTLGLGNPLLRYKMANVFRELGGTLRSAVSPQASIGSFGNTIGDGCTILAQAVITNGVTVGEGVLINPHVSISHDASIGQFCELSPGVRITGHATAGRFSRLGTNAVVLPNVAVGQNVTVGAGAVVIRNTGDNVLMVGVPAREKQQLAPLTF